MAIRKGVWDCPYCGAARIDGPVNECPTCGAPRDKDVKMYLPDDAIEVTDEAAIAAAEAGADWRCGYCGRENKAGTTVCGECGATSSGDEGRRGEAPKPKPVPQRAAAPAKKGGLGKLFIILGVLAAIGFGLWFFIFRTHSEKVEVLSRQWERTIQIEKLKMVTEEDWEHKVPRGARELTRRQAVFKTEKVKTGSKRVKTGTKDMGNGYFKDVYEDRPIYKENKIYRDKVRYQIERWKPERKARASGNDPNPRWPEVKLRDKERQGAKSESLTLQVRKPDGETETVAVDDETLWKWYEIGKSYTAQVRASGGISDLQRPAEAL